MIARPRADVDRSALQHRDVERVDLGLEQHDRPSRRAVLRGERDRPAGGLDDQALQRPVAALDHLGRNAGQRDDRADLGGVGARELERRHVVLDTVVVRRERRRSSETDGTVRGDESSARERAAGRNEHQERGGECEDGRSAEPCGGATGHGVLLRESWWDAQVGPPVPHPGTRSMQTA